jgi:hypothetical protein
LTPTKSTFFFFLTLADFDMQLQLQLYSQVFDQKIVVGGGDESISVKIIYSHPFEFNRKGVSSRSSVH